MTELTGALKTVPKWAWFTSAGVGLGAAAIYTFRARDTKAKDSKTPPTTPDYGAVGDTSYSSPVPGIVVPDINFGSGAVPGETGYVDLHQGYLDSLGQLMQSYRDQYTDLANQNSDLLTLYGSTVGPLVSAVGDIVTGGGAASTPAPAGAVAVQAPTSQTGVPSYQCPKEFPLHSAKGCYKACQTAKDTSRGCMLIPVHVYQDGHKSFGTGRVAHKGKCADTGLRC